MKRYPVFTLIRNAQSRIFRCIRLETIEELYVGKDIKKPNLSITNFG